MSAGITRERLESFDRPIKVEPEDYPDKRDALISEFRNYLGILKVLLSSHFLRTTSFVLNSPLGAPGLPACCDAHT